MNEHPDAPPSPTDDLPPASEPNPSDAPPPNADSEPGQHGSPWAARYGLVRPLHGRYLGGVCAAIGRATNTDPVLWRVVLAVTSVFGIGILIYLAGWLVMPAEGDTASPVEALLGRGRSRTSPLVTVVLGGLALLVLGYLLSDGFRGWLLVIAVVVGVVMLVSRNAERGPVAPPPAYPPPGAPEATQPFPPAAPYPPPTDPYAAPAEPYGPTAGPYPAAYTAPAAPAGVSAPPPGPPGYRAPFAPRGPYAGQRPTPPPPPPGANPPPAPRERSRLGFFTLSLVLVALGTLAALNLAGVVRVGAGGYLAATLAMVGAGLVVGAWFGRARWLIALGTLLALGLGVASAAEHIDTSNFGSDLTWRPASVAELDDQYVQNLGSAKLDLRQIDFTGHSATVTARINAGSLEVLLPPDVDTTVEAKINAGDARIFDQQWSGLRVPSRTVSDPGADGPGGGHLQLNIRANASSVEVHR